MYYSGLYIRYARYMSLQIHIILLIFFYIILALPNGVANFDSLSDSFESFLTDQEVETTDVTGTGNDTLIEDFIFDLGENDLETYISDWLVGGYFEGDYINDTNLARGYFNNEALHSPALALNAISNAILR